jgi:hypothetical protein
MLNPSTFTLPERVVSFAIASGGVVTVRGITTENPPLDAVIIALPTATPVTTPVDGLTVAIPVLPLVQARLAPTTAAPPASRAVAFI